MAPVRCHEGGNRLDILGGSFIWSAVDAACQPAPLV